MTGMTARAWEHPYDPELEAVSTFTKYLVDKDSGVITQSSLKNALTEMYRDIHALRGEYSLVHYGEGHPDRTATWGCDALPGHVVNGRHRVTGGDYYLDVSEDPASNNHIYSFAGAPPIRDASESEVITSVPNRDGSYVITLVPTPSGSQEVREAKEGVLSLVPTVPETSSKLPYLSLV